MTGFVPVSFDELLAEIAALPPEDARQAMGHALRESQADRLTAWMILGEDDDRAMDFRQFLALAFVDGTFPPKYVLMPGASDPASLAEIDAIVAALEKEKPSKVTPADLKRLQDQDPKTLVYLAYGLTQDDATPKVALWHHPKLGLRRAVRLALEIIAADHRRRVARGS